MTKEKGKAKKPGNQAEEENKSKKTMGVHNSHTDQLKLQQPDPSETERYLNKTCK